MLQHLEKTTSPHNKKQLFDLVMDIEKYPEFLPWCADAEIVDELSPQELTADLTIDFKAITKTYRSLVSYKKTQKDKEDIYEINVKMIKGPFKSLINKWRFSDDPAGKGSIIEFEIELELKSKLFSMILGQIFDFAYKRMVAAFCERADEIYK